MSEIFKSELISRYYDYLLTGYLEVDITQELII